MTLWPQCDMASAPVDGPAGGKNPVRGFLRNMTKHCIPDTHGVALRWYPHHASQALQTGLMQAEVRTATADRPLCMSRAAWNLAARRNMTEGLDIASASTRCVRHYLQIFRRSGPLASGTCNTVRTSPATADAFAVQPRHGKCLGAKLPIPSRIAAVSNKVACCRVAVLPCAAMLGSLRCGRLMYNLGFRQGCIVFPHQV
jgi:hypothetical protein